jgi:holo-[acyl-carrier protein] synthase
MLKGRVFTDAEWDYCMRKHAPWPSFAARFAAKEAVAKAFGTGFTSAFKWTSVEVYIGDNGVPFVQLDALGMALLKTVHATTVHLSLSHCKTTAIAVVLIE